MPSVSNHAFMPPNTSSFEAQEINFSDNSLVEQAFDEVILAPLLSGSAYHVDILEFKHLESSSFANRFDEFGLDSSFAKGYVSEYNIAYQPFVVHFEFQYDLNYINNDKDLFAKMSSTRYCNSNLSRIADVRRLDMACAIFGDFELSYIEKERIN